MDSFFLYIYLTDLEPVLLFLIVKLCENINEGLDMKEG
mgnify:CR=1 FL=1